MDWEKEKGGFPPHQSVTIFSHPSGTIKSDAVKCRGNSSKSHSSPQPLQGTQNGLVKLVTMLEKVKGSRRRPPTISLPTGAPEVSRMTGPTVLARVAPGLLVSGYEATLDLSRLQTHGVTHVLNLAGTQNCPPLHPRHLVYQSLHIPDNPKVDILFFLYLAFEFITAALGAGGCVLVHCSQGISRAPTVACAYLMWSAGLSQRQALAHVLSAHPRADPNLGFLSQLQRFQEDLPGAYTYSAPHGIFMECRAACFPTSLLLTRGDRAYYLIGAGCEDRELRSGLKMLALLERFGGKAGAAVQGVPNELGPVLQDLRISLK